MPNLKDERGTYKGLIGEILFVIAHTQFLLPRFHPRQKYLPNMRLNEKQKEFTYNNWYSIDAVSYDGLHIVEVKTRNRYKAQLQYLPKTSARSAQVMEQAKALGFNVILVTVWLEENWNYTVDAEPFDVSKLSIDTKKPYDKTGHSGEK